MQAVLLESLSQDGPIQLLQEGLIGPLIAHVCLTQKCGLMLISPACIFYLEAASASWPGNLQMWISSQSCLRCRDVIFPNGPLKVPRLGLRWGGSIYLPTCKVVPWFGCKGIYLVLNFGSSTKNVSLSSVHFKRKCSRYCNSGFPKNNAIVISNLINLCCGVWIPNIVGGLAASVAFIH